VRANNNFNVIIYLLKSIEKTIQRLNGANTTPREEDRKIAVFFSFIAFIKSSESENEMKTKAKSK
jgi:hypothetical protein